MTWFTETSFNPRPCRRCGLLILAGSHGGVPWRLDPGVAPVDGRVLAHYGHGVLTLINTAAGVWAADLDPGRDPPPGTWLAASHVCGSAHSQRLLAERQPWTPNR